MASDSSEEHIQSAGFRGINDSGNRGTESVTLWKMVACKVRRLSINRFKGA